MIVCENIPLNSLVVSRDNNTFPDVNIGIITFGDYKFLVQLIYTKPSELVALGATIEDTFTCRVAKTLTIINITFVENTESITCLNPIPSRIDNDHVVLYRFLYKIDRVGSFGSKPQRQDPLGVPSPERAALFLATSSISVCGTGIICVH